MRLSIRIPSLEMKTSLSLVLLLGLSTHLISHAQVGFVMEQAKFEVCMVQNWDTPIVQSWLAKRSKAKRMQIYGSSKFSGTQKKCLMESKPLPQEYCNRILTRYLKDNQNSEVDNEKQESDEPSYYLKCLLNKDQSNDDWLPADLALGEDAQEILRLAEAGDRAAQQKAFRLYSDGEGTPPNLKKADYWLRKLADNGDADAQWKVGVKLNLGQTTFIKDLKGAVHYLKLSAENGYLPAMSYLADFYYYDNSSFKKDLDKSVYWFTKASGLGDAYAEYRLGQIYEDRSYKKHNLSVALTWYSKAAKLNQPKAMIALAGLLTNSANFNSAKALEAHAWYRKADALGENGSTIYLVRYFPWSSYPKDERQAIKIQLQYAEEGDTNAQLAIAQRYFNGVGVSKDHGASLKWWMLAANAGDPIGQRMLGSAYLYGWGIAEHGWGIIPERKEFQLAIQWLEKAANQGDQQAMFTLGFAYINTLGQSPDKDKRNRQLAVEWMRRAAEHGYSPEVSLDHAATWERSQ